MLTDAEESDYADPALMVSVKETDAAALGTGERGIALPKAFPNAELTATQAKDPDCLRYMQLVNKPRALWSPHLAAAPLQFLYGAVVRANRRCSSAGTPPERRDKRTEPPAKAHPALPWPSPYRATRGRPAARHTRASPRLLWRAFWHSAFWIRYWWPLQRANVRAFLARCTFSMADAQISKPWHWLSLPFGTPFEIMAVDIFRPLRSTARGPTHILLLSDHHTRRVELITLPEPTDELVAKAIFQQWISRWGTMRALLTDNGRQFTARLLQQLTDVYGIKHIYSSAYNPRGNSVVESYMLTLKTTLKLCTHGFQTNWDAALQAAALAYRATPHMVTGHTPFFLVTGYEVALPLSREWHGPALCTLGVTWLEALWRCRVKVIKAHEIAADENARAQTSEASRLRPGNHVALRLTKAERQAEGKFRPLFKRL